MSNPARICVVIASTGRPTEVGRWPEHLARQSVPVDQVIFSLVRPADCTRDVARSGALVLYGSPGLCAQRNRALRAIDPAIEIVAFFDDDYVPSRRCIEGIVRLFADRPDLAGATGKLLADGINGPGIAYADAVALVRAYDDGAPEEPRECVSRFGLYGCNMAFRVAATVGLQFEEALPKYGWQEDVDFARQVADRGPICHTNAFVGVHQGVKGGRASGTQLGYSQIANPIYLVRKGTMSPHFAGRHMVRNLLSNIARSLRPEPWVDRRGRLKGNLIALADVCRGRADPRRIDRL